MQNLDTIVTDDIFRMFDGQWNGYHNWIWWKHYSNKYINVLDLKIWPVITENFENQPWDLQQDYFLVCRSSETEAWKEQQGIQTLTRPHQSPDINIIENVWHMVKIHLEQIIGAIRNRADLSRIVKELWLTISLDEIKSLFDSNTWILKAVVKIKYFITKYWKFGGGT